MRPQADKPSLEEAHTESGLPQRLGDFEIVDILGQGGSGVVYAARLGTKEVALKVLRADEVPTQKERQRFVAEAENMARIRHPNVVRILSVGELGDGRPFLAMERLHGHNLAEHLAQGPLALGHALTLFDQLAASVAAMHTAGLIHRDLKCENVMLVDQGNRVVLLDFGIARATDAPPSTTTQAGLQRGTPAVMAPERFFGARATMRSDIYELAVIFYVMVTGGLPWRDPLDAQARLNPTRPGAVGAYLPPAVEAALMRAMSATVEERPASIAEFAGDIRRAAQDHLQVGQGPTQHDEVDPAGIGLAPTIASTTKPVDARRRSFMVAIGVWVFALAALGGTALLMIFDGNDSANPGQPGAEATPAITPIEPEASPLPSPLGEPADPGVAAANSIADGGPVAAAPTPEQPVEAAPVAARIVPTPGKTSSKPRPTTPTPSKPASTKPASTKLPWCSKVAELYCTTEFNATEGGLTGVLCNNMREQVIGWGKLPDDGIVAMEDGCKANFPKFEAAVKERLRLYKRLQAPPPSHPEDGGTPDRN